MANTEQENDELQDDYPDYDGDDGDDEEDLDGIGGECLLCAQGGTYWCGRAGSEECDFECNYGYLVGKRVRE